MTLVVCVSLMAILWAYYMCVGRHNRRKISIRYIIYKCIECFSHVQNKIHTLHELLDDKQILASFIPVGIGIPFESFPSSPSSPPLSPPCPKTTEGSVVSRPL
jgi:hypothetical protein